MSQPDASARFFESLRQSIEANTLTKLTLGKYRGADSTLQNVFVRTVTLKTGSHLTFVYRHDTRDITKNHPPADGLKLLQTLIGTDFLDAHLFTTTHTLQLTSAQDGSVKLRTKTLAVPASVQPSASTQSDLATSHDRARRQAIPLNAPWLLSLGITNNRGQPREGMSAKLRQINKFTELLSHLATEAKLAPEPTLIPSIEKVAETSSPTLPALRIADMGCGKGYLTFATAALFGPSVRVQGIENRSELVELCNRIAREQHFENLHFTQGTIADTNIPQNALDILIALHACDTATDDAIAKGIAANAKLIVVSPCCQKELRPQLTPPPVLASALRHGIFQERHAEFVTDALRAQLLEYAGYTTKVFEFISTEHTAKNLMISAIKTHSSGDASTLEKIRAFARFYGIRNQALATHLKINLQS